MNKAFPLVPVVINIVLEILYTATSQNMPGSLSTILKGIHDWEFKSIVCLGKSRDGCALNAQSALGVPYQSMLTLPRNVYQLKL